MDNVITFQMRSAEQEEDLGELWERMQANLTAVSSSRANAGGHNPALSQPGPPYIPWLGTGSAGGTSGPGGTRENIWSLQRPRVLRACHSLPLSPQGTAMSPARQVGAGFPIWLLWAGAGPVPGAGAAPVAEPGKHCSIAPHTPDGRPGLSPALAPAAEAEPRSVLSAWCSKEGTTCCSPSVGTPKLPLLSCQDDTHSCPGCHSDRQAHP